MPEQIIDLGYHPRPWQERFHEEAKRFSVAVCHRRAGKTVLALRHAIDRMMRLALPNGRYAYIAPFLKQAKKIAWTYLKDFIQPIPGTEKNEAELWVQLPNGARLSIYGADNPDSIRGEYFDGAILDEVALMDPEVWGGIVRPALSDRGGWALFIGTPDGTNLFSELYYAALLNPEWHACLLTVYDTGALPAEEIAQLKKEMSESQFAREFLCDFAAGNEACLLSVHDVMEAQKRVPLEAAYRFAPRIIGVDVARYGDDRSCIIKRQGIACWPPMIYRGRSGFEIADIVAGQIHDFKPDAVFVDDTGGFGGATIERLRQLGHEVIGVQFAGKPIDERYLNKRAEMWIEMAKWVKEGGTLPDLPEIRTDLCAPTYKHNAAGKFQLESKEDMKKRGMMSPDVGDALCVTFHSPVSPKGFIADMRLRPAPAATQATTTNYDPLRRRR